MNLNRENILSPLALICAALLARGLTVAQLSGAPAPVFYEPNTNLIALSLTIRCTNTELKVGDVIPIEFTVTNIGSNRFAYSDRKLVELAVTKESGEIVAPARPVQVWLMEEGRQRYEAIDPGESFSGKENLDTWALIKEPGRYLVTASYTAERFSTNAAIFKAEPIAINVLPRTDQELLDYVSGLTNQIEAKLPVPEHGFTDGSVQTLAHQLALTRSPKMVPTLVKAMYEDGNGGWAEADLLRDYAPRTDETRKILLDAAMRRGLQPVPAAGVLTSFGYSPKEIKPLIELLLRPDNAANWAAGAELALRYPNDSFTPELITAAANPASNGREQAINALMFNRTAAGVKALKALFRDPDQKVQVHLAVALINAYLDRIKFPGTPPRPGDFSPADVKPLLDHLLAFDKQNPYLYMGVSLTRVFDDGSYTARLIDLATNSRNLAQLEAINSLALNRTDQGVKTLHALLNNPEPQVRNWTSDAIHAAYTARGDAKGKPLKPDDFDPQYQQPKKP